MNLPYLAAFSILGDLEELLDKREGEFIGSRKKIFLKFLKKNRKKVLTAKMKPAFMGGLFTFKG